MTDQQVRNTIRRLYRVAESGEKGFATAATNVPNPGLKVLFKTFAAQRAQFKQELLDELHRMGQNTPPGSSIPGMIHRGRVAIFAGMSGDQASCERVILREASLGERVAVNAYTKAMDENLPVPIHEMVSRQMEDVRLARQQINLLLGQDGQRALVHLYESDGAARQAIRALEEAGFPSESIHQTEVGGRELYTGRGATVPETVLSGAVGGALWGSLTGILVGIGVVQTTTLHTGFSDLALGILAVLAFILVGAGIASVLALFIGVDIAQGDQYHSRSLTNPGQSLVMVVSDPGRVPEASRILANEPAQSVQPVLRPSI